MKKVYAVLNEDRGGDTDVTIHFSYKSAKSKFDEIVNELRDYAVSENFFNDLDDSDWILTERHLGYDFTESWGNIMIYEREVK